MEVSGAKPAHAPTTRGAKFGTRKSTSAPGPDDLPIQHEQGHESRKVIWGCVGFLLKPNKDAHHQPRTHSIVHLGERRQKVTEALCPGDQAPPVLMVWDESACPVWLFLTYRVKISVKLSMVRAQPLSYPCSKTISLYLWKRQI